MMRLTTSSKSSASIAKKASMIGISSRPAWTDVKKSAQTNKRDQKVLPIEKQYELRGDVHVMMLPYMFCSPDEMGK